MKRLTNLFKFCFLLGKNLGGKSVFNQIFLSVRCLMAIVFCKFYKSEFVFDLEYRNTKFNFLINNRMDLAVLGEIFVNREYEFNYSGNPKVILDLGANVGDTAIFYSILFPEAKIYAVEPNPQVHAKLEQNTKQFPNIKVCKCAVSNTTGKINLYFGDSHLGSSINMREQNTKSVEVDVSALEDFCAKENISHVDILKFDIEGAEEYLLQSPMFKTGMITQIAGEMHDDLVKSNLRQMLLGLNLSNVLEKRISKSRYIIYGKLI